MKSNSIKWRKSSRCATCSCVEVAQIDGEYLMRDSKNPDQAPLSFTPAQWSAFIEGVRAGEFSF